MKSILIYSGGLDSTVLLYKLHKNGLLGGALAINYAQRHAKELEYAKLNCKALNVDFFIADLSSLKPIFGDICLTGSGEIPNGGYDESNMRSTVVPNRNMIFLSLAAAKAISCGCDSVAYAAHGGDHSIYPDCRNEFAEAMDKALNLCDYNKISLFRPFVNSSKADIVKLGSQLGVDFSLTWSCYNGGEKHCGICATCIERKEAFKQAKIADPTEYLR